jgi:hypothetical protein
VARGRGCRIAPDLLDEDIGGHRLARAGDEQREQRTLLRPAQARRSLDGQRSQDPEDHR